MIKKNRMVMVNKDVWVWSYDGNSWIPGERGSPVPDSEEYIIVADISNDV